MSDDVYEEAEFDSLDDGSSDELNTPTDYANPLDLLNQVQPTDFVSATVTNYRRDLLKRLKEVREEALVLYEPTYYQEAFHACKAKEALLIKANQVGGPQKKTTPVLTPSGWRNIGDLQVGDEVICGNGNITTVVSVTQRGWLPIFELTFDDGASTNCSEDHFWTCKLKAAERFPSRNNYKGGWHIYSLREIREYGGDDPVPRDRAVVPTCVAQFRERPVPVAPYTLGVLLGDGCIRRGVTITSADPEIINEINSELPDDMHIVKRETGWSKADEYRLVRDNIDTNNAITTGLRELGLVGKLSHDKFIPDAYLRNSVGVRLALLQGLMDTDGYCAKNGVPFFYTCSPLLASGFTELVRSLGGKSSYRWKEAFIKTEKIKKHGRPAKKDSDYEKSQKRLFEEPKRCLHIAEIQFSLPPDMRLFRLSRKQDRRANFEGQLTTGRVLHSIRPAGNAECVCIGVADPDHTYVTENYIVTHNSLAACVEIARAVTGADPHDKYPKKDGIAVCVGYGERHIGTTFYRKLFKRGAFEIIRDLKTGKMRTYRPWPDDRIVHGKHGDLSRAKESLPAPPLIPKRFIDGNIAWVRRSEDIFAKVKFTTGWELYAANSAGDPEHLQGLAGVWLYVFDEDVAQSGWYEEAVQRTAKTNGYLRWNAMPHAKTNDITAMMQRAEEEEGKPNPQTVMIRIVQKENPYLSDEFKEQSARIALSMGEDVYRKRILGEMTTDSVLVYREYQKHIHTARPKVTDEDRQQEALGHIVRAPIVKAYSDNKFVIPENWTRRTFTDPGHSACATLFVATPPPEIGDFHIAYDELYITQCTAKKFARDFKVKIGNQVIEEFLFDMHGGHLRGAGDRMWYQEYQDAIEEEGVRCEATGARFRAACDKIKYREEQTRSWLGIRESGPHKGFPTVYIDIDRCPNLAIQIERFKKKQIKVAGVDQVIDEANRRGAVHAIECLEYAAGHGCHYVRPREQTKALDPIDALLAEKKRRRDRYRWRNYATSGRDSTITLGPQGSYK